MKKEYDHIDMEIIHELRDNCKRSIREFAKKLGIHPNTLLQRIKKLEKEKVILKYTAEIDYFKLGYDIHAVVLGEARKGRAGDPEQLAQLSAIPEIQSLYACTGLYDIIAVIKVKDRDQLVKVLQKIGDTPEIVKTTTHLIIYSYKNPHEFNPTPEILKLKH
jgi:DNA-binding Lrp family transcriptional regulator